MAQHVFLTGLKQVGKSTLCRKILRRCGGTVGGFFTVRTNEFLQNAYSVHLFSAAAEQVPTADNLLFVCGKADAATAQRFERLGCCALQSSAASTWIVLDELGPHEAEATLFRQRVCKLLDGTIPVLGVLQAPASLFWPEIVSHPNVRLLEITEENRAQPALEAEIVATLMQTHVPASLHKVKQ